MAQNDMHVVVYKILSYLYKCLKSGEKVDMDLISAEMLGINQRYWRVIVGELVERGYVSGYRVTQTPSGITTINPVDPTITMSGVEFLMENSMMRKALDFLRTTKDALPFL